MDRIRQSLVKPNCSRRCCEVNFCSCKPSRNTCLMVVVHSRGLLRTESRSSYDTAEHVIGLTVKYHIQFSSLTNNVWKGKKNFCFWPYAVVCRGLW